MMNDMGQALKSKCKSRSGRVAVYRVDTARRLHGVSLPTTLFSGRSAGLWLSDASECLCRYGQLTPQNQNISCSSHMQLLPVAHCAEERQPKKITLSHRSGKRRCWRSSRFRCGNSSSQNMALESSRSLYQYTIYADIYLCSNCLVICLIDF